jgi:hypothetical protein
VLVVDRCASHFARGRIDDDVVLHAALGEELCFPDDLAAAPAQLDAVKPRAADGADGRG